MILKILRYILFLFSILIISFTPVFADGRDLDWISPVIFPVYNDLSPYLNPLLGSEHLTITDGDTVLANLTNDHGTVIVSLVVEKAYLKIITDIPLSDEDMFIFENLKSGEKVEYIGSVTSSWKINPGRYRVTASFSTSQVGNIKIAESQFPYKGNVMYVSSEDSFDVAKSFAIKGGNVFIYSDTAYKSAGISHKKIKYTDSISDEIGNPFVDLGFKRLGDLISLNCPNGLEFAIAEWTYLCEIPTGKGRVIAVSRSVLNLDSDILEKFLNLKIALLSDSKAIGWDTILPIIAGLIITFSFIYALIPKRFHLKNAFNRFVIFFLAANSVIFLLFALIYILSLLFPDFAIGSITVDFFKIIEEYKYLLPQFLESLPYYSIILTYVLTTILLPSLYLLYIRYAKSLSRIFNHLTPLVKYSVAALIIVTIMVTSDFAFLIYPAHTMKLDRYLGDTVFHNRRDFTGVADKYYKIDKASLSSDHENINSSVYYKFSTSGMTLPGLLYSPYLKGTPEFYDNGIASYTGLNPEGDICYGENLSSFINPILRKASGVIPDYISSEVPNSLGVPTNLKFFGNFGGIEGYVYLKDDYRVKISSTDTNRYFNRGDLTVALYSYEGDIVSYKTIWDSSQDYEVSVKNNDLTLEGRVDSSGLYYLVIFQGAFYDLENYLGGNISLKGVKGSVSIDSLEVSSGIVILRGLRGETILPKDIKIYFQNIDGLTLYEGGRKIESQPLVGSNIAGVSIRSNSSMKDANTFYSTDAGTFQYIKPKLTSPSELCSKVYFNGSRKSLTLVPGQKLDIQIKSYGREGIHLNNLVIKSN
ncbi:hypothetical protein HYV12_03435 [Candidatus Dojkabacteria bacterium]|nr:hypothetical protein [Candidatus Dojkabacteria bacterium]